MTPEDPATQAPPAAEPDTATNGAAPAEGAPAPKTDAKAPKGTDAPAKPAEGDEKPAEGEPKEPTPFERSFGQLRDIDPEMHDAALKEYIDSLPEERRPGSAERKAQHDTDALLQQNQEKARALEASQERAQQALETYNGQINEHLEALYKRLNDEGLDLDGVPELDNDKLNDLIMEYAAAKSVDIAYDNMAAIASRVIDRINQYGDPLQGDTLQGLMRRAKADGKDNMTAYLDELEERIRADHEKAMEPKIQQRINAEAAALSAEKLKGIDIEPATARSGGTATPKIDLGTRRGILAAQSSGAIDAFEAGKRLREL